MSSALDSRFPLIAFETFHESELPRRIAAAQSRLPSEYAGRLRPLGIRIRETGEGRTYLVRDQSVIALPGDARAELLVEISQQSFDELVHDLESAAGLIYGNNITRVHGELMNFMQWEPALRWMFTGRPVYDPLAIDLRDLGGAALDPTRGFELGDDREEMAHFLRTAGYLWVRNVFSDDELAALRGAAERLRDSAREGDQESWWGRTSEGETVLCRVLRAGKEPEMAALQSDPRVQAMVDLCDVPMAAKVAADEPDGVTVLWKQPGVEEGLADLPWHRDCGMGGHASMCPTAVLSIFLGSNDPESGELRFLPGSWKTSLPFAEADDPRAPRGVAPPAKPGDLTFHYGDGLHVAPAPTGNRGSYRTCILVSFAKADGLHHRGGRHYNDVLLGSPDGQIEHMSKVASRT